MLWKHGCTNIVPVTQPSTLSLQSEQWTYQVKGQSLFLLLEHPIYKLIFTLRMNYIHDQGNMKNLLSFVQLNTEAGFNTKVEMNVRDALQNFIF